MSAKKTVFLTGATGSMGSAGLRELCKNLDKYHLVLLVRPSAKNREMLQPYAELAAVKIVWGDLNNYEDIKACVQIADIVLHVAAFVSPEADYYPELAMQINYGSTCKIIKAIKECQTIKPIKLVYIGTIAQTGDRMPPIHWGRVGDPIKPSIHDYYAVSKVAAERAVIESGLKYWVSLRQTGIFAKHMCEIQDGIIFHNCLNNVLEYVSDDDSGVLLSHVCEDLPEEFWGHIYNIGGGKATRLSAYQLYSTMFGMLGITKLENALEANWFATRNFHGQFYLDSDKLEDFLHFRSHDAKYLWDIYENLNKRALKIAKIITKLPGGEKLVGNGIKSNFKKLAKTGHGTLSWLEQNNLEFIEPFFISREQQELIPLMKDFKPYANYQEVIHIEHG